MRRLRGVVVLTQTSRLAVRAEGPGLVVLARGSRACCSRPRVPGLLSWPEGPGLAVLAREFRLAALVGLVLRLPARFFAANLGCDLHGKLRAGPGGDLGGHLSGSGRPRGSPGDRVLIVDIPAAA